MIFPLISVSLALLIRPLVAELFCFGDVNSTALRLNGRLPSIVVCQDMFVCGNRTLNFESPNADVPTVVGCYPDLGMGHRCWEGHGHRYCLCATDYCNCETDQCQQSAFAHRLDANPRNATYGDISTRGNGSFVLPDGNATAKLIAAAMPKQVKTARKPKTIIVPIELRKGNSNGKPNAKSIKTKTRGQKG